MNESNIVESDKNGDSKSFKVIVEKQAEVEKKIDEIQENMIEVQKK